MNYKVVRSGKYVYRYAKKSNATVSAFLFFNTATDFQKQLRKSFKSINDPNTQRKWLLPNKEV